MLSHLRYKERGSIPRRLGPISSYSAFFNVRYCEDEFKVSDVTFWIMQQLDQRQVDTYLRSVITIA